MNHVRAFTLAGAEVEISHTGYTGEATGFEIFVHPGRRADRVGRDPRGGRRRRRGAGWAGRARLHAHRSGLPALRARACRAAGPHAGRRWIRTLRQGLQAVLRRTRPLCAARGRAQVGHRALLDRRRAGAHGPAGRSRDGCNAAPGSARSPAPPARPAGVKSAWPTSAPGTRGGAPSSASSPAYRRAAPAAPNRPPTWAPAAATPSPPPPPSSRGFGGSQQLAQLGPRAGRAVVARPSCYAEAIHVRR